MLSASVSSDVANRRSTLLYRCHHKPRPWWCCDDTKGKVQHPDGDDYVMIMRFILLYGRATCRHCCRLIEHLSTSRDVRIGTKFIVYYSGIVDRGSRLACGTKVHRLWRLPLPGDIDFDFVDSKTLSLVANKEAQATTPGETSIS